MKALVIGCGSIGTRRGNILSEMGHEVAGFDTDPVKMEIWPHKAGALFGFGWADVTLICTPPHVRSSVVRGVWPNVIGLFIEKPLALTRDEAARVVDLASDVPVTMGACNLRFDARLEGLAGLGVTECFAVMRQAAKYWNPDHERVSMILDSIHELDLVQSILGPIQSIGGFSDLNEAFVRTVHEGGINGSVTLDRVTDPPMRELIIDIAIGGVPDDQPASASPGATTIRLWPPDLGMYEREMRHFMGCVEAGRPTCNPIEDAADLLGWALQVVD